MAGMTKIKVGEITQGKSRGKSLVSALSEAMKSLNVAKKVKKGKKK